MTHEGEATLEGVDWDEDDEKEGDIEMYRNWVV
jgi:hypothetical protein